MLDIFGKNSVVDPWEGPKYGSETNTGKGQKAHHLGF